MAHAVKMADFAPTAGRLKPRNLEPFNRAAHRMQNGKAQAAHVEGFASAGHLAQLVGDQSAYGFKVLFGVAGL